MSAAWWRAALGRYPGVAASFPAVADDGIGARGDAELAAAKALRAVLRRVFTAVADGGDGRGIEPADVDALNRVLGSGQPALDIERDGRPRAIHAAREVGPRAALLPIAHSALDLLTGKDRSRLHRCGNERCVLLFYDTTKSATRRWCSVGCMNRARSAARYRARKVADTADTKANTAWAVPTRADT